MDPHWKKLETRIKNELIVIENLEWRTGMENWKIICVIKLEYLDNLELEVIMKF